MGAVIVFGLFGWFWDKLRNLPGWLFGKFVDAFIWFNKKVVGLGDASVEGVLDLIGNVVSPEMTEETRKVLSYVDYFFPFKEAIGYGLVLFGVWVAVSLYRLVKSWIPNMGG
ncbi:hypothetical protein M2447_002798 [Ereboglobus sp. PH5-10]|uniref:hypothetical protein n=1 Tax=Ereboglobus sp. PH5-10 TaxID=2940629 RepID=UPI00240573EA|nr:hypothetical protein [Ereboglobus sp. PH5-10]MDF9828670.1 hypothetical protein [Ereboglobus sp. PH5-10]